MTSTSKIPCPIQLRGRLNGQQRQRLRSLLDMLYTPLEISIAIGITRRQIYRVYEKLGCPIERDSKNRLWINGKKFAAWYFQVYPKVALGENQTFCASCKQPVAIGPCMIIEKNGLVYAKSPCPHCGRTLIKFLANRKETL